ncbi:hypothetical protein GCM10009682_01730 [Luedemannella flava]|uniref:Glycosyltransferase n=1 Tax=Luedemannella flava TaxID=349316 RepID=A0ABP4XL82_9ACTN
MVDLVIVIPTRARPATAAPLAAAFAETCTAHTLLALAVDDNDETAAEYAAGADVPLVDLDAATPDDWAGLADRRVGVFRTPSRSMVAALNLVGVAALQGVGAFAVGFMGDDNRPRTHGWDSRFVRALRDLGTGIVYGNDLIQGERLPTQVAITADIVRELGWVAPPTLTHLYIDNFWADLGRKAGCLRYLDDVIIEHLHPLVGKADVDAGYRRVNSPVSYQAGETAYNTYLAERMTGDAERVRALRTVRA